MLGPNDRIWRLSKAKGALGLSCSEDGLFLGHTPLLERERDTLVTRPQAELEVLLSRGFGFEVALDRAMGGLAAVASALNAHDLCRARIAAVQLRIPNLPDAFARLDMQIEDVGIKLDRIGKAAAAGDWDPDKHPRTGTAPNPGWFAPTDSSGAADDSIRPTLVSGKPSDDGKLHLPPGERNDEIGDLLEWIANAKPEDAQAISGEINRLFYQAGDFNDGAMFHHALAEVLAHPDEATRERILDSYEPLTRRDPSDIGEVNAWLEGAALGRLPALRSLFPGAQSGENAADAESAVPEAEAAAVLRAEFWKLGWSERGFAIHTALDGNLPWWFQGIDDFSDGVATSFKTIDLNAATYQDTQRLLYAINRYVNKLASFSGKSYENAEVRGGDITSRVLKLVVPEGSISEAQQGAIDAAVERAKSHGIALITVPF